MKQTELKIYKPAHIYNDVLAGKVEYLYVNEKLPESGIATLYNSENPLQYCSIEYVFKCLNIASINVVKVVKVLPEEPKVAEQPVEETTCSVEEAKPVVKKTSKPRSKKNVSKASE